ncbi:DUF805 domain-containing protein [Dokdonia sp.]|uniref:DUF805 domain-containing protein n=1 Tax=Dokdonia sp. TaxID=2024995 RepID=UPI0032665EF1
MQKTNNIYNYKTNKNKNEETHFLYIKGRITIKAFLLRVLLSVIIYISVNLINLYYIIPKKEIAKPYDTTFNTTVSYFDSFYTLILPIFLILFIIIQGIKRIHDINKSGWFICIPLYNLILLFSKGSIGSNKYGIDPKPSKNVTYYDEIKNN